MHRAKIIAEDYENGNGPFADVSLPEHEVAEKVADEDKLAFFTFSSMLNYNRNSRDHWSKMLELYQDHPRIFNEHVPSSELADLFDEYGVRYPNRDAETWAENFCKFNCEYDGIDEFISGKTALEIREDVDEFTFLGGNKLAPLWIRIVHELCQPVPGIEELEIPVDVHIRRVSEKLMGPAENDDIIRARWKAVMKSMEGSPVLIDKPLWLIGNYYSEWGKEYVNSLTSRAMA